MDDIGILISSAICLFYGIRWAKINDREKLENTAKKLKLIGILLISISIFLFIIYILLLVF